MVASAGACLCLLQSVAGNGTHSGRTGPTFPPVKSARLRGVASCGARRGCAVRQSLTQGGGGWWRRTTGRRGDVGMRCGGKPAACACLCTAARAPNYGRLPHLLAAYFLCGQPALGASRVTSVSRIQAIISSLTPRAVYGKEKKTASARRPRKRTPAWQATPHPPHSPSFQIGRAHV